MQGSRSRRWELKAEKEREPESWTRDKAQGEPGPVPWSPADNTGRWEASGAWGRAESTLVRVHS